MSRVSKPRLAERDNRMITRYLAQQILELKGPEARDAFLEAVRQDEETKNS